MSWCCDLALLSCERVKRFNFNVFDITAFVESSDVKKNMFKESTNTYTGCPRKSCPVACHLRISDQCCIAGVPIIAQSNYWNS